MRRRQQPVVDDDNMKRALKYSSIDVYVGVETPSGMDLLGFRRLWRSYSKYLHSLRCYEVVDLVIMSLLSVAVLDGGMLSPKRSLFS